MKKLCVLFLAFLLFFGCFLTVTQKAYAQTSVTAAGACLMDFGSGEIAFEKNGKARLPIASMTKIMTLNVIFDEVEEGNLNYDDTIIASENAMSMGGSQVFLESGGEYKAADLIKSIVVASANDACVALAEHIEGSEQGFVDRMNEKAASLNMLDTNFVNCTGLPCINGYSSAIDMCIAMRELISHKGYFDFSRIWLDKIEHPLGRITEISNTNKLLRRNVGVDGGKTGYTSEAKHCITATAVKGNQRFISCIIGADSSIVRFDECEKLLKYGFGAFDSVMLLDSSKPIAEECPVKRGNLESVKVAPKENYCAFTKKRQKPNEIIEISFNENVKAPVSVGQEVGLAKVYKEGNLIKEIPLIATEKVIRRGLFQIFG